MMMVLQLIFIFSSGCTWSPLNKILMSGSWNLERLLFWFWSKVKKYIRKVHLRSHLWKMARPALHIQAHWGDISAIISYEVSQQSTFFVKRQFSGRMVIFLPFWLSAATTERSSWEKSCRCYLKGAYLYEGSSCFMIIILEALIIIILFQSSNNPLDFDMDNEEENGA